MTTKKISAHTALGAAPATGDYMLVNDIAPSLETKTMTVANLFTSPSITTPSISTPTFTGAIDGGAITLHDFLGKINAQTGTTYGTVADDNGQIITLSNASAITLTVHAAAPAGWNCLLIQLGAGQVTIAASGGNVRNRLTHTKIAGQYGMVSCFVVSNAGTAPELYIAGDTAA
jgi:predicted secreted protein